ncbi:MAG: outer membrane lipoprotein carrier protein LolA [Bdellovibrionota bacterium]
MIFSFIAPFIVATVVLVPKTGVEDKKQPEISEEAEASASKEVPVIKEEKKEGVITLRKAAPKYKYIKVGKGKKAKRKKVLIKEAPSKTEFDEENLDAIYEKERKYFNTTREAFFKKKKTSSGVSGALASIPAAVANSIAVNVSEAKIARTPKPPPPPAKPVMQTAEQFLNVEDAIQEKRKIAAKNSEKFERLEKAEKKLAELKEKKKSKTDKDKAPLTDAEVKDELQQEMLRAVVIEGEATENKRGPSSLKEDPKKILKKIETKYITHFVRIDVKSEVTQALLERTKTYTGKLYMAPEGRFKMDMKEPNKHMLLMNGKNIWVVDYPLDETQDKVQILHSKSAKNLKNQAFLDIFMGVGSLEKRFKIESSDKKNDEITYKLIPKEKDAQIERVELKVDVQAELISSITFWDSLGNKTQLRFSEQDFSEKVDKEIFKFKPPKDAAITYL